MTPFHAPIDDSLRDELSAYDDLTAALLARRGVRTAKEAEQFLNPSYERHLHDPLQMKNMPVAAARLARAISDGEYIAVWSDYDADGIPGGVVLHDFLKKVGAHFTNYIPHRHLEGYGVNVMGIEKLAKEGVALVITVDSGITDTEPVARAKELGVDVIVTDHHQPGEILPDAYAVVDPKQDGETYPFRELCGAALAWKLVVATLAHGFTGREHIPEGWEKWLLDMAGLATIADMVPLVDENRVLAHYGLLVLRKSPRAGLVALCRTMRVNQRALSEDDVSFMIAPRVNAASRMGDPIDAFRLFATDDIVEANELAKKLEAANRRRRSASAAITRHVHARLAEQGARADLPPVLALGDPEWSPALLGLVAGTIAEEYGRSVFLWGREVNQTIKGSCRSNGTTDVFSLMNAAPDTFVQSGGHALAGGFSVRADAVFDFATRLNEAHARLLLEHGAAEEALPLRADAELALADATHGLLVRLEQLAPFGEGNRKPAWLLREIEVGKVSWFGKNEEHLKISLPQARSTLEAVAFFAKHDLRERARQLQPGTRVTLLAHVERDTFLRRNALRLRVLSLT
ncbi:MAG: single-stranded-DNA-specific exonuclease RecJ [Parcubacteria group bacterium 21-54-25]|nr:MAG: single-stranded-DNA-specific exonuclease RecJ [Parcubacteria group bacterium 21-54-25]HQU07853.1 single-stranded-DNA-specific exonuclease RecJ [Candidatus Paceibacterota bacterium]